MPLSVGRLRGQVPPILKTGATGGTPAGSGLLGGILGSLGGASAIPVLKPAVEPSIPKLTAPGDPIMNALRGNSATTPGLRGGPTTDLQRRSKGGYRP
jgi:hypothetical protein